MIALKRTPAHWSIDELYKAFDTGTTKGNLYGVIFGEYPLSYDIEKSYVYARYEIYNDGKNVTHLNGYTIFQGYASVPIPDGIWKGEYYELMNTYSKTRKVRTYAGYVCDTEFGTVYFIPGTGVVHFNPMRNLEVKVDDLYGSMYELYYIQDGSDKFPVLSLGNIRINSDKDYRAIQARRSQLRWVDLENTPLTWEEFETVFPDWNEVYLGGPGLENH